MHLIFVGFVPDDNGEIKYIIFIEQRVLCTSFVKRLYFGFAVIVFNLEWVKNISEVAPFIQEFVFELADKS